MCQNFTSSNTFFITWNQMLAAISVTESYLRQKHLKNTKVVRLLSPNTLFLSIYHFMALLVSIVSQNFEFAKSGTKTPGYSSIISLFWGIQIHLSLVFVTLSLICMFYYVTISLWILTANARVKKYSQRRYKKLERKGNLCECVCVCLWLYTRRLLLFFVVILHKSGEDCNTIFM